MILGITKENIEVKFAIINGYMEKIALQKHFGEYSEGGKSRLVKVMKIERASNFLHENILKNREYHELKDYERASLNKSLDELIQMVNTPEQKFRE